MVERVEMTHVASAGDSEFAALVRTADAHRDRREWNPAEDAYWRALNLYPYHFGYRVQYAHMLKEQQKFVDAEVHYRSALAFGASATDVEEHLSYVSRRQGIPFKPAGVVGLSSPQAALERTPNIVDIELFSFLFFHETNVDIAEAALLLRKCETCRDVAIALAKSPRFESKSRMFLEILAAAPR
jgi:tetratricopeptide (TPR) repeat protein